MHIYKKVLSVLLIVIIFSLFLMGCNNEDKNVKTGFKKNVVTESSIKTEPENINSNDTKYMIKTKSIITNNIHVSYPQIVGLVDLEIQNKWNSIIKQKVDSGINNIGNNDTYVLSYKVKTQNEKMISILMIGETSTAATDYEKYVFKYTYNIDIDTGESVRLKDSIDTEKIAKNLMAGNKYSIKDAEDSMFREYLDLFYENHNELCTDLNTFDFGENLDFVSGYSYFENGKVYLCMNVSHSLGDYIEILIDN